MSTENSEDPGFDIQEKEDASVGFSIEEKENDPNAKHVSNKPKLLICHVCDGKVASNAKICPHCGAPQSSALTQDQSDLADNLTTAITDAKIARNRGDISLASEILLPVANDGHAEAQFLLGEIHSELFMSAENNALMAEARQAAIVWFRKAAEKDHKQAAEELVSYLADYDEYGIPAERSEFRELLDRLEGQDSPMALHFKGCALYNGELYEQNQQLGISLLQRASDLGSDYAPYVLATIYLDEQNPWGQLQVNRDAGFRLMQIAAQRGVPNAIEFQNALSHEHLVREETLDPSTWEPWRKQALVAYLMFGAGMMIYMLLTES
jgi:TPR repeat protein